MRSSPVQANRSEAHPDPAATPVIAKTTPLLASDGQTSQIIRDLKGINMTLTKALETQGVSDPDAEVQRQSLRRRYQTLLFSHHPHPALASLASTASTPPAVHPALLQHLEGLWIQTTHNIIALHRAKITELSGPPVSASSTKPGRAPTHVVPPSGRQHLNARARPVELRKQLTKFRAFLSAEIAFYSALAARFVRSLGVEEARPFLTSLGIVVAEGLEGKGSATHGETADAADRATLGKKAVTKVLVCLGDLERYKEMYSERERERKGRLENGKPVVPQDKRFERAKEVYSRARDLMPENGNPFNQLAVISTYVHDPFSSTYFYLRALSIQDPFVTARGNLQSTLRRPLDAWKAAGRGADVVIGGGDVDEPRLKKEVVLLQAMFALKSGRFSHQSAVVLALFRTLLLSRSLEVDTILRTVVLPFASHWDGIFSRPIPRADKDHARSKINVEAPVLEHILDLLSTLLEISAKEIKETLSHEQRGTLAGGAIASNSVGKLDMSRTRPILDKSAQHLTAVLRRVLPTLRVISKWIIAHSSYLARASTSPPAYPSPSSSSSSHSNTPTSSIPSKITHLWRTYTGFLNTISVAFPFSDLKPLEDPLAEDVEMKGFGPLGKRMGEGWTGEQLVLEATEDGTGLHPNEEMLLRLWDLQKDGRALGTGQEADGNAAVKLIDGRFTVDSAKPVSVQIKRDRTTSVQSEKDKATAARPTAVESTAPPPMAYSATPPIPAVSVHGLTLEDPTRSPPSKAFADLSRTPIQPVATPGAVDQVSDREMRRYSMTDDDEAEEAGLNDGDSGSHASTHDHDLELASVSTETEDDPVNRAMRAALDDDEGEDDFEDQQEAATMHQGERPVPDAEEERIVWPVPAVRRDTVTAPPHSLPPRPFTPTSNTRAPPPPSGLTALDLLMQISSTTPKAPAATGLQGDGSRSSNLLFGPTSNLSSIWGTPVGGGSGQGQTSAAPPPFQENQMPSHGHWRSLASDEASRMHDGLGGGQRYQGQIGQPSGPSHPYNPSAISLNQSFSSPELRFSHGPSTNTTIGLPPAAQHHQAYSHLQQMSPFGLQSPAQHTSYPSQNGHYPQQPQTRLPGQPSLPALSSAYRSQAASPANGFAPAMASQTAAPASEFMQQYQHRSTPSFNGQRYPLDWAQSPQPQPSAPSAPPGLGESYQQQQHPGQGLSRGLQPSYSSPGGAGRQNPWG